MHSLYRSSDEKSSGSMYPEFNEDVDMAKPDLKVGMKFKNTQVFGTVWENGMFNNGLT